MPAPMRLVYRRCTVSLSGNPVQQAAMKHGDRRVKYMSEILQNIRAVKLYGWEKPVSAQIEIHRDEELRHVRSALFTRGWLRELMFLNPQLIAIVIFTIHVYGQGNTIETLTLFEILALVRVGGTCGWCLLDGTCGWYVG